MLGQQGHHLVGPVAGALLDERAHLEVLSRADRLGQHAVGNVADQDVLERELPLTGSGPSAAGPRMSFSWSATSALPRSRPSAGHPRERALGERPPTTDACCTSRRSNGSSESSRAASTAWTVSGSSAA